MFPLGLFVSFVFSSISLQFVNLVKTLFACTQLLDRIEAARLQRLSDEAMGSIEAAPVRKRQAVDYADDDFENQPVVRQLVYTQCL